jgi:hypothetical protein
MKSPMNNQTKTDKSEGLVVTTHFDNEGHVLSAEAGKKERSSNYVRKQKNTNLPLSVSTQPMFGSVRSCSEIALQKYVQ